MKDLLKYAALATRGPHIAIISPRSQILGQGRGRSRLMESRLDADTVEHTQTLIDATSANGKQGFLSGLSPAMLTLESVIGDIARTNIPVLLVGESGSGKQMFAHQIHLLSPRREEALVKIACAAMTPETISTELGLNGNGHSAE